jgi:AcrR family transcriptional regulator
MDLKPSGVKPRRRYDASRRRHQALETRADVVAAAERLFLSAGYAETTIATVAAAANVSVETIYKQFGGKPGLVRAIFDQGLAGAEAVPAYQRSDQMRLQESDPRRVIRNWGAFVTELAPRGTPILLLMRTAAASDPELARVYADIARERLSRMELNAIHLYERGYLRAGVTIAEARDLMWLYTAPDLYELLVLQRGWSPRRFGQYVAEALIAALLPPANSK